MPWRQEAMKGVGACDKLRLAGKRAMIRRCPNGETRQWSCTVTAKAEPTRGTETSKYPQERKSIETSLVAASEREIAQTDPTCWGGVVGLTPKVFSKISGSGWEATAQRVTPPYAKMELS